MFVIFKKNLTKSRKSCLTEKGSSPWHPCKCILLSIHWYKHFDDLLAPLNREGDWVGSGWPKTQNNWLLYMGLEPEVPETSLPISRSFHTLIWGVGFFIIRHRYVLYCVIGAHRMLGEYLMSFWFPLRLAMCSLCWAAAHFSNTLIWLELHVETQCEKKLCKLWIKFFPPWSTLLLVFKTSDHFLQKEKWLWWQMMGSHAVLCSSSEFPCLVDQGQVHVCLYLISPGTHKLHLKMKKNEKKDVQTNQS